MDMKNIRKILGFFVFTVTLFTLPKNVFAADVFDKILTNGKLVIPSVPQQGDIAYDVIATYFYEDLKTDIYVEYESCNATFTRCTLKKDSSSREVEVVWKYDKNIKKIVDKIVANYPVDQTKYIVEDYEILNKHINGGSLISNSTEFKKNIQYKNFYIDTRGGGGVDLTYSAIGMLKFKLDGTLYWKSPKDPTFIGYDLVYVKEDVLDVAEALEERLEKLFPNHTFVVEVTEDKISDIINDYILDATERYNDPANNYLKQEYPTLEDFLQTQREYDFLDGAEEYLYDICVDDAFGFQVAVKKNTEKAVEKVEFITNDVLTNISITTIDGSFLPLDTKIEVSKITSGNSYKNLIKLLAVTNSETYDLKLYSSGIRDYINKLDNGKFQVKIPVSDALKNKKLIVYYVDSNNKIEEHEVKIEKENGETFAVFETDHFSIYTLADVNSKSTDTKTNNPPTADNILLYISTLLLSIVGLLTGTLYIRKVFRRNN